MEKRKDSLFYSFFPHSCPKLHYVFLCNGFKSLCTLQFHKKKGILKNVKCAPGHIHVLLSERVFFYTLFVVVLGPHRIQAASPTG